jgi:hypothetical protein
MERGGSTVRPPWDDVGMPTTLSSDHALAQLDAALDALAAVELSPSDVDQAVDLARRVEAAGRRVRAKQVEVVEVIEARGLHVPDGHGKAAVMVGAVGRLSEREWKRRDRARRMFAEMPAVKIGMATGRIGACQVDRLSLVFVNPRVQAEFVAIDAHVARLASVLTYEELDRRLTNWVRQVDEDGTADRARRAHENRRARLTQDFDGGWELLCLIGGVTGAQMHSIFRAFVEAEFQADWAEAREVHGEGTKVEHLARTFDQREADAIARIFEFAANAFAAAPGGAPIDTTIVMDSETFEREARRAAGATVEPRPVPGLDLLPTDPDPDPEFDFEAAAHGDGHATTGSAGDADPVDDADASAPGATDGIGGIDATDADAGGDAGTSGQAERSERADEDEVRDPADHPGRQFRCESIDGHPIDPTEAFANALVGRVRRSVVGWDSVVLDMSGLHKLFTGPLRAAVMMYLLTCYWPGCNAKVGNCQADHLHPRRSGGRTNPGNGAPACGRHNRLKEHGFTAYRDQRGRMHVLRPDGTEIDY